MPPIVAINGTPTPLARPGDRLDIDPHVGVARDVRLPGKSARLLEGAKIYIQRSWPDKPFRAYQDVFGRVVNVRERGGVLFGDVRFNPHHQLAPALVYDLEREPSALGLSQTGFAPVSLDVVPIARHTSINNPAGWASPPLREQTVPKIAAGMLSDPTDDGDAPAPDTSASTTDPDTPFDRAMHRLRAAALRGEPIVRPAPDTIRRIAAEMIF